MSMFPEWSGVRQPTSFRSAARHPPRPDPWPAPLAARAAASCGLAAGTNLARPGLRSHLPRTTAFSSRPKSPTPCSSAWPRRSASRQPGSAARSGFFVGREHPGLLIFSSLSEPQLCRAPRALAWEGTTSPLFGLRRPLPLLISGS